MKTLVFILLGCMLLSCKQEVITKEPTLEDTQKKFAGYWKPKYLEQEFYSGNVMTSKILVTLNGNSIDFKNDFTYISIYGNMAPENGKWELISTSYFRFDKATALERYYHIITLDDKNLVYRGPFDANGNAKFHYLITAYCFK